MSQTPPAAETVFVFKFGGSCLLGPPSFSRVEEIIREYLKQGTIVTVTSALNGVTNILLELAEKAERKKVPTEKGMDFLREIHYSLVDELFPAKSAELQHIRAFLDEAFQELKGGLLEVFINGLDPLKQDFVVHFGEWLSTRIFTAYLQARGIPAEFVSSTELIEATQAFGNALPRMKKTRVRCAKHLLPRIQAEGSRVVCIPGFYGITKHGNIATLGRGGSDFTATILANCLSSAFHPEVVFWKDVAGLLSTNPKLEPNAKLLQSISYAEAKELAFYGSKVLHPLCLTMLEERRIPANIKHFHEPFDEKYTRIVARIEEEEDIIKAITALEKISMVTVESQAMVSLPGIAARLFKIMGDHDVNINFISQSSSENNITFTTDQANGQTVKALLHESEDFGKHWFNVKVDEDVSLIAVVGAGMLKKAGIAGRVFTALGNAKVNVVAIAQGSSEMNISIVINRTDLPRAIRVLHSEFIR